MIKEKIADMTTRTFMLENMVYLTAGIVDQKSADYSLEAAACKIFGTESLWQVCNHGIQTAGGIAYVKEYPYERMMRDARINMIFEGTNEILHLLIALTGMRHLGDIMRKKVEGMRNPVTAIPAALSLMASTRKRKVAPPKVHEALRKEANLVADSVSEFGAMSARVAKKYRKQFMDKEYLQQRVSDIVIDIYGILASLSRTSLKISQKGLKESEREIELTRAVAAAASERIHRNFAKIEKNDDPLTTGVSDATVNSGGYNIGLY